MSDLRATQGDAACRLLYVVNDARYFLSHRASLAAAAAAAGYRVHVAVARGPGFEAIGRLGFTVHHIPFTRGSASPWRELLLLRAMIDVFRRVRPHTAHLVGLKAVLSGGVAARICGTGNVVCALTGLGHLFTSHGRLARIVRSAIRPLLRFVLRSPRATALFQNPDDLSLFSSLGLVRDERAHLIRGSGVDLGQFGASEEPPPPTKVLLAARIIGEKGVREYVRAAEICRAAGAGVVFQLAGAIDDQNPSRIDRRELDAWVAAGSIEYLGERDDMPALLRSVHIVCLPSYREGLPKVLLEAAASQRAIVTTNVPGCREAVLDGVSGVVVPVRDAAALARAIQRLAAAPELRVRMGREGRLFAEREHAIDSVVARTLALYHRPASIAIGLGHA